MQPTVGRETISHLQRTPEFYTIAKTRGNCLCDACILRFGVLLASLNNAARARDTSWLKRAAVLLAPHDCAPAILPMKLVLYPHSFSPSVGGIETIVPALARGLAGYAPAGSRNAFDGTAVPHGCQTVCPTGVLLKLPELSVGPGYFRQRKYGKCLRCLAQESGWLRAGQRVLWRFPRCWLTRRVAPNIAVSHHEQRRIDLRLASVIYHGTAAPTPGENAWLSVMGNPAYLPFTDKSQRTRHSAFRAANHGRSARPAL